MTGDDHAEWIATDRRSHCSYRRGFADTPSDVCVGGRLPRRSTQQGTPNPLLKGRTARKVERQIESPSFCREVSGECLTSLFEQRMSIGFRPVADVRQMFLSRKPDATETAVRSSEDHVA